MKNENPEQMSRIVDAVMIYCTYFVPVHPGGKTVADFLDIEAPAWLSALVTAHREKEPPLREARTVDGLLCS